MASQNINQYVYPNLFPVLKLDTHDMSLTSDELDFNQEVVFSPYLIAQTYGNRLPFYFDINNPDTAQPLTLQYKNYNRNNIFVSQNYYNPNNEDLTCFTSSTICDIGLTGVDNGLVSAMTGESITITKGLFDNSLKFDRMSYDRRLKLFQVTGNTTDPSVRFSGFNDYVLYEVVSKTGPNIGIYHELYGGFYQGFYKLFGYDYEIFPERMNKGWAVEMLLKPRLFNEYFPGPGETTLNEIYPANKNMFFYFGTRAENKFYHYADGTPNCFTGYTRVTSSLTKLSTCACCDKTVTNSRCIYVYPPRSANGKHDPHVNYGCDKCGGNKELQLTCGCNCGVDTCETCGWECQYHECGEIIQPTPTPTPTPTSTPTNCIITPQCTPTCSCTTCDSCSDCPPSGFTSIEDTCEKDPLYDGMSNAMAFKLCGNPKNPQIGVKVFRFTGDCITTGSCATSGITYQTGYTITEYCSPGGIYPECLIINPAYLEEEHWFQLDAVWERYTWFDLCDLGYKGGLENITKKVYLESLANNGVSLISVPYTKPDATPAEQVELVNLNEKWLLNDKFRKGRLKFYINGRIFWTIEDFEELIPRALNTDKEKQVGVPFNISWGGGTQGLRENVTFADGTSIVPEGPYIQDPENFPTVDFIGTTFEGLQTNIKLEEAFAGTFEGAISQFRMYVTPLSAPEVKHNFKLLQYNFDMFNPDCPDCSTSSCGINDFTYVIGGGVESIEQYGLGREFSIDERDKKYLIENKILLKKSLLRTRFWNADGWWGNQGNTPQCVGYAWAHFIDDGPITHNLPHPNINPELIYNEAQKLDEWFGEDYEGTSVRGGAKYLHRTGKIKAYYWTYDIRVLINTVLTQGPVVAGTNWYYGMFFPDRNGLIRPTGRLVGGHAYLINGVDTVRQLFRIKNSWGRNWGSSGHAFISFSDMQRLINQNGEICLAIENRF